jgi:replication factor C subunit 3/5
MWSQIYRPKTLDELQLHACTAKIASLLQNLARNEYVPHLLFYGTSGAGKKTFIRAFLHDLYGKETYNVKPLIHSGGKITIVGLESLYHLEINCALNLCLDTEKAMLKMIVDFAETRLTYYTSFRILFIKDVHALSKISQQGLLRIMETHIATCRIIICCTQLSKIIKPLRSRMFAVRIPCLCKPDMIRVLNDIAAQENLKTLEQKLLKQIVNFSNRNLFTAINVFQKSMTKKNLVLQVGKRQYLLFIHK